MARLLQDYTRHIKAAVYRLPGCSFVYARLPSPGMELSARRQQSQGG